MPERWEWISLVWESSTKLNWGKKATHTQPCPGTIWLRTASDNFYRCICLLIRCCILASRRWWSRTYCRFRIQNTHSSWTKILYSWERNTGMCLCVWAVEKWRTYLWDRKFTLRRDHQALTMLLTTKGTDRAGMRIALWAARFVLTIQLSTVLDLRTTGQIACLAFPFLSLRMQSWIQSQTVSL